MEGARRFRMGRLDHVHIRVPDRAEAAAWYAEHLGFEPVEEFDFWATGFEGGPLQISADGGETMLALFEAGEGHPMIAQETGVAFSVDADAFLSFARSLPGAIQDPTGRPLVAGDVIDFDLCWAFDLADPWGNQYELNCYDYERIRVDLIESDAIVPVRYWPPELYERRTRVMNQKLANATGLYLEGIRDGNVRAAVEAYTGDRYTQHSTGVADGVEGFVEFFDPFVANNPVRDIQVIRSIVDGSHVFVHAYQDINNGRARWVTTDLFDTDGDDKIVEHWDVIAAFVDESANGHTQVDGPTEIVDEDRTEQNKAMVASFIDDVLVHRRVDRIGDYVSAASYVQHNPLVADGIDVFRDFMNGPGRTMVYRDVFKIIGQGNFVMSYGLVGFDGTDMAVFDIFRVEDGLIVEHWDNMEPIPEGPQPNSGKF